MKSPVREKWSQWIIFISFYTQAIPKKEKEKKIKRKEKEPTTKK